MLQLIRRRAGAAPELGPEARKILLALFALFPLALLAGVWLEIKYEPPSYGHFQLKTDRAQAIQSARGVLVLEGLDTDSWTEYCGTFPNADLDRYYTMNPGPETEKAQELIPAVTVQVMFRSPDRKRSATVTMSFNNSLLGFDLGNAGPVQITLQDPPPPERMFDDPRRVAEYYVGPGMRIHSIFAMSHPEVATLDATPDGVTRKYTWHAPYPQLREIDVEFSVAIRNRRVLSRSLKATVDPEYAARRLHAREKLLTVFGVLWLVLLLAACIYSVISYARRANQNEVSHSRTLLMALLVAILFTGVITSSRDDWLLQSDAPPLTIVAAICFATAAAGILIGIGYGSGEGDVREAYPGKLTSLDALVLGKIFSRNVGRSVLMGAAFAGWFLLLQGVLLLPVNSVLASHVLNSVKFPFMHEPWLWFLLSHPAVVIVFAVAGLLQPLAFATRFFRKQRARRTFLLVFAGILVSGVGVGYASLGAFLIAGVVSLAGLLIPFFAVDLLASIVCLTMFQFVDSLVRLTLLFPAWTQFEAVVTVIGCITLAIEAMAWRRGRAWTDEEVRPEYARHIAERQALEAEVSAAREAQLRLLPQAPPHIPGLTISASCLPARVVGGDFYDFFPLRDHRLGVFIAEGGNRSFASALSIALAKGYLMHMARGGYSPTEVIQRLESTLGSILEGGVIRTTVAYAVVDAVQGTVRYARTGAYPRVVIARAVDAPSTLEREVVAPDNVHRYPIHEGSANLEAGDSVVFYTDGIARRISQRSEAPQEDWILRLARTETGAEGVHFSLLRSIGVSPGKAEHELEDDLTAIVIRCADREIGSMEVVA